MKSKYTTKRRLRSTSSSSGLTSTGYSCRAVLSLLFLTFATVATPALYPLTPVVCFAEASMTIEGRLDMPTNYEAEGQMTMAQAVMNMERSKVSILRRFSTLPVFNLSSISENK